MWKQKIGISLAAKYTIPTSEVIDIVAAAKFDAVSPIWMPSGLEDVVNYARQKGLYIQSLHAPFDKSADMWSEDAEVANPAVQKHLTALKDCADLNIPVLVCHTWKGFKYEQRPNEAGLKNYRKLVEEATRLNVKIAFENTEGQEFLEFLMMNFEGNENVGFCWDSGHEMCYNHSEDLLAKYGKALCMTHLNDNLGISSFEGETVPSDDLHLLPFDGIANWENNVERMKKCPKLEYLNFELGTISKVNRHDNDIYSDMKMEIYFAEAYKRACKIASMYI